MKQMFSKTPLMRLSTIVMTAAAISAIAAEPTVQEYNGKSYYLTGAPVEIATWKYGALGVYTTIHDDWGSSSIKNAYIHLDTVNTNRGLITSTCAISDMCDEYYVTIGKEFIRHGHDLHSHSQTHTQGMSRTEIFNSKKDLEAKFDVPVEFYVFPFDQWNDEAIQSLKDAGYIGARSGNRYPRIDAANMSGTIPDMTNDANFEDPFALQFDVFPRSNSGYKNVPDNGDKTAFLKRYVSDAIKSKGWAIQEFHDISNSNSLSIPLDEYQSLMDSVASAKNKNEIWSSGPTEVVRYRFAREFAGEPSIKSSANGYELSFAPAADVSKMNKYHTPLSVFFRLDVAGHIAAYQNGKEVPSRKINDGYFALEADPTLGAVSIIEAAKPYMAYPFLDPMDTIPSDIPAWISYKIYNKSKTQVYHNGAIWENAWYAQYGEPGVNGVWSKVRDVTTKALNARTNKGGSIEPSGKKLVEFGAVQEYKITAEPGYEVDYVLVNGVNVGAKYSHTFTDIRENNTIEAILSPIVGPVGPTWTITSEATAGGTITPAGEKTVKDGGSQAYAVAAETGNRLDSLLVDGVNKGKETAWNFTGVKENHAIKAYFSAVPTFTINTAVDGPGSVDPMGATVVSEGDSKVVSFAADNGARFDSVLVNGAKVTANGSYEFLNVTENQTLTAYFSAIPRYSINATAEVGGTITPSGVVLVTEGDSQRFDAAALNGNVFTGLVVNSDTLAVSTYTFSDVRAPQTIKALFEAVPTFTLTVDQSVGGTITPATTVVNEGADQTVAITADEGYEIADVLVDGKSVGARSSYTFEKMSADRKITAQFTVKTFAITSSAGANGTISPLGETVVEYGKAQEYTIIPATGYEIDKLTVNGKVVTAAETYKFSTVKSAQSISVTFKEVETGGCADIKAWSANDHWTSYKVGDERSDNGKIYQCTNTAYSFYQPSSVSGRYGWKEVGSCN